MKLLYCRSLVVFIGLISLWTVESANGQVTAFSPVTDQMLLNPDPADWLMVHRTYDFQSFSPLDQINRDNVGQLRLAWMRTMDEGPQEIRR